MALLGPMERPASRAIYSRASSRARRGHRPRQGNHSRSNETGLAIGTPVVVGGGDCQVGALGLGVVNEGDCAVIGGTFWQQVVDVYARRLPTRR